MSQLQYNYSFACNLNNRTPNDIARVRGQRDREWLHLEGRVSLTVVILFAVNVQR